MPGADGVRFIQQYSEFGLKEKMPFTGFTAIDSQTPTALGKVAIGITSALTYTDTVDNPESKEFAANFKAKYKYAPDLFADYGYVGGKALGETLKLTDGDASDKDKLAEAMTKVNFNAPRGPFRMDPATHNPIQNIYIAQVIASGDGISTKIISTAKDVQDPGKKVY
jgi:branched-chain amino acid transport system substrate-binding protein